MPGQVEPIISTGALARWPEKGGQASRFSGFITLGKAVKTAVDFRRPSHRAEARYVFSAKGAVVIPAWGNAPGNDDWSARALKARFNVPPVVEKNRAFSP